MPVKRPAPSSTVDELHARIQHLEAQLTLALSNGGHLPTPEENEDEDQANAEDAAPAEGDHPAFIQSILSVGDDEVEKRNIVSDSLMADKSADDKDGLEETQDRNGVKATDAGAAETPIFAYLGSSSALFALTVSGQIPKSVAAARKAQSVRRYIRLEYWEVRSAHFREQLEYNEHAFWPEEQTAKRLVDTFFSKRHPRMSLGIDHATVWNDYNADATKVTSTAKRGRLYAIFAVAAWHAGVGTELVGNRLHLAGLPWFMASRHCVWDDSELSEPMPVAQALVLQCSFALVQPPMIASAWRFAGNALRVLMDLGAHRQTLMRQLSGQQARERQHTFWSAYAYEKVVAIGMGRAPSLWSEWVDAELPKSEPYLSVLAEMAVMTERILKAKYTAKRHPADATLANLRGIQADLRSMETRVSMMAGKMDQTMNASLAIVLAGTHLLLHQPELLSKQKPSAECLADTIRAIKSIISTADGIEVGTFSTMCPMHIGRAAALSHALELSPHANVREALAGTKQQLVSLLRRGEQRWMSFGKLCDLLMLPVNADDAEWGADGSKSSTDGGRSNQPGGTSHRSSAKKTTPTRSPQSEAVSTVDHSKSQPTDGFWNMTQTNTNQGTPSGSSHSSCLDANTVLFPSFGEFEWPMTALTSDGPSTTSPFPSSVVTDVGSSSTAAAAGANNEPLDFSSLFPSFDKNGNTPLPFDPYVAAQAWF